MTNPPDSRPDPTDQSEQLLIQWQESGDRDALDQLLRNQVQYLRRMLRGRGASMLKNSLGATDIAHEAVLRLLNVKTAPKFDNPAAFRGYLWTSAWRLLHNRLQKRGKKPLRLDATGSHGMDAFLAVTGGVNDAENSDRTIAIDVALNLLKPQERDILTCVYLKEMDIPEAAKALGLTKDAANMRLVRARRRLAEKLSDWAELIG